ncbi:hypothetical protein [Phaeovulum sp.]|uniref:hypothetical protein n=1 Tax=Phaeovulum sp. TaxID=2934796 RepID=UPI0039E46FE9
MKTNSEDSRIWVPFNQKGSEFTGLGAAPKTLLILPRKIADRDEQTQNGDLSFATPESEKDDGSILDTLAAIPKTGQNGKAAAR